ncbi:MAG: phosphodiesterase [Atopobiaceae bacterium]|nr:phosphodiesterase [Atopobiaceae bacterium]
MKLIIASDIHGAARWCKRLMEAIEQEKPDRVVLLGDLLYHGPRNDLPADYAPKQVIEMLNALAPQVIAVRGNCEAEVDQMVLGFPCMADYALLADPSTKHDLFLTHGHVYGAGKHNSINNLPKLRKGDALVYGHTHVKVNEKGPNGIWLFNPGSVGIPKDGTHSFGVYEDGRFEHRILGDA